MMKQIGTLANGAYKTFVLWFLAVLVNGGEPIDLNKAILLLVLAMLASWKDMP